MPLTIFAYPEHDSKEFPLVWGAVFSLIAFLYFQLTLRKPCLISFEFLRERGELIISACVAIVIYSWFTIEGTR